MPEPQGLEQRFSRPVLVVQANFFNQSAIQTVVCVVLTSKLALADAPGNIVLKKNATKLSKDSVANVSQIVTIDKYFLTSKVSALSPHYFSKIEAGIKLVLNLT